MAAKRSDAYLLMAGLAALFVAAAWLARPSQGQPPQPVAQGQGAATPTRLYYGLRACSDAGCHGNPASVDKDKPLVCDYDEVRIFTEHDKHAQAHKVLENPRSRKMAELLGLKKGAANDPSCLGCHAVLVKDPKAVNETLKLSEGISCGVCHGHNKEWVSLHSALLERNHWRSQTPKEKEAKYGMTDLWDPEKRAALCASCHIGNTKEGKVVTHAMYAAGHPPLPGIEMATFSNAMPRHWKYRSEKDPKVREIINYDAAKEGLEQTKFVVVAALVSFRESLNLLADQASADAKEAGWPELAQFDCYACHHDLKSDSWRQKRGYAGKPGRPTMRAWVDALVPLTMVHASKDSTEQEEKLRGELNAKMKELTAALDAQPFGDAKRVAQAARQTADWANGVLKDIRSTPVQHAGAKKLLDGLGKESKGRLLDFDSARQFAWAFREIQKEADPQGAASPEIVRAFKELAEQLKLDLPKGQVEIAKDYLKEALEKLNSYEPERFRQSFDLLVKKRDRERK